MSKLSPPFLPHFATALPNTAPKCKTYYSTLLNSEPNNTSLNYIAHVPAAGATADSPDQKGLVGDKGQLRSSLVADVGEGTSAAEKAPAQNLVWHRALG